MSEKSKKIMYWSLTAVIAFVFIGSAMSKIFSNEAALQMTTNFGFNPKMHAFFGIVELVSVILFIIPRTGILGTFLLVAYTGGAIAIYLEYSESIVVPCLVQILIWIVAIYRFPELRSRIMSNK